MNLSVDDFLSLRQVNDFKMFKLIIEGAPKSLERVRAVMSTGAEIIDDKNAWISESICATATWWTDLSC